MVKINNDRILFAEIGTRKIELFINEKGHTLGVEFKQGTCKYE